MQLKGRIKLTLNLEDVNFVGTIKLTLTSC